jgi:hypothetical protein
MPRRFVLLLALPLLAGAAGGMMRVADFGAYWSAARVNLAGGNPYDPQQVLPLERRIEPERTTALPIYAPPWSIALVTPFAWPDFRAARLAWLAFTVVGILAAVLDLWALYGGRPERRWAVIVLAFTFYPVLQLLGLGQLSGVHLFALTGFLAAERRGRPILAGLFASLGVVKPQTAGFFALVVALWLLDRRRWGVLLGGVLGVLVLTALAVVPNPHCFAQYRAWMAGGGPTEWIPPTPGSLLRALAGGAFWPALIPPILGVVFVAGWYRSRRARWDWPRDVQPVAFAMFFCSPYAWIYDECLLLVPLTAVAAAASGRLLAGLLACLGGLTAVALAMYLAGRQEYELGWLAPAVLVLWLVCRSRAKGA